MKAATPLVFRGALVLFVVVVAVEDAVRTDFSPLDHWVSHLSIGPWGWIQILNFLVAGSALVAFGLFLHRRVADVGAWPGRMVTAVGIAFGAAGLFVSDPPPDSQYDAAVSWHGQVHDIAGGLFFVCLTAACVVTRAMVSRVWGWIAAAGVLGFWIVASVLAAVNFADGGPSLPSGLAERLSVLIGFAWLFAVATQFKSQPAVSIRTPAVRRSQ
ncbi:DUF998 domain-containing protein [Kribbella sp. NBC_00359]|uniref:DUF998 domain-containing protein n=1 Tax=Kribbella sp. NBC_00359 TaxID=2975966 RepID=UPI002E1FE046